MSKFDKNISHVDLSIEKYKETAYLQAEKGLSVYNQALDPLESGRDWLQMQSEELIDAHQYLVAEMERRSFAISKIRELSAKYCDAGAHMEINHWLDFMEGK